MDLYELPLADVSEKIRKREVSPVEVTRAALQRLDQVEPTINAFVTTTAQLALEQASRAEREIAAGHYRGPLHGIPLGVKDVFDTAGVRTTSGTAQRATNVPVEDAASVTRLYDAGMVLIGKTQTHEIALGATTPTTGNPWAPDRTPGGSSGGSGAAVSAGIVHIALGTDSGGSVRIPAALCGTVGLKPTFGRVSRAGVAPLSWSLDHVGLLSRNVIDTALAINAIAGYDPRDPATINQPVPNMVENIDGGVAGMKIGIPTSYFNEQVDPECAAAARSAAALLEGAGGKLVEVDIPMNEHLLPTEWAILLPEAAACYKDYLQNSPEKFTDDVRTLLEVGATALATDYISAQRLRTLVQAAWRRVFSTVDVILTPTVAAPASLRTDPFITWPDGTVEAANAAYARLSAPANVTGLPALSMPMAFSAIGLPLGVQIIGPPLAEPAILRVGRALEQTSSVAGRISPVASNLLDRRHE